MPEGRGRGESRDQAKAVRSLPGGTAWPGGPPKSAGPARPPGYNPSHRRARVALNGAGTPPGGRADMSEARLEWIGRYGVLAELGRGAMGVVYKARDPQLDRLVAIKTVRRDLGLAPEEDAELRKRVHQEATAAGRLAHPNIVAIHDVIELDGIPYIVMEYVEGPTLADLIAANGSLPPPQAVRLAIDVCNGLDYAHGHGV